MRLFPLFLMLFWLGLSAVACSPSAESPTSTPMPNPTETTAPTPTPDVPAGISIQRLDDCQHVSLSAETNPIILYDADHNALDGWSHITSTSGEFAGLQQPREAYTIGSANRAPDPTCGDQPTYQVVLVKKLADWDRQHANGLEPRLPNGELTFGEVDSLILDLKVDSDRTYLPTPAALAVAFGEQLTQAQLAEWESGQVNLGLTLLEPGFNNQAVASYNLGTIVAIDPAQYADQWIRVTISAEALDAYLEENYARTDVDSAEIANHDVIGLRINPETQNGSVLRSYVQDAFDPATPEQFKEMGLSLRTVAITRK